MNLLIDPLPTSVNIEGQGWPIHSEFYVGVLFELLMQNDTLTEAEKIAQALSLYYSKIPPNIQAATDAVLWFYRCGKESEKQQGGGSSGVSAKKAYCFEQDTDLIFSAFYAQYHIDLAEADGLHWWKFRALFNGLSAESEIKKIMGYRTADLKDMSKDQKKFYEKMRRVFALRNQRSAENTISLAERNQRMKDYVARRFSEVGGSD